MPVKKALIMVDLQNDFCAGGQLAVPGGDEVVPLANRLAPYFDLVVATKDWHPSNHQSFASQHAGQKSGELISLGDVPQILWPDHCVQNSKGARFHPALLKKHIHKIIHKGTDKAIDSYSAFYDNAHLRATGLYDYLTDQGVDEVYLLGLATDYCVKYSALDAIQLGFPVFVITDACRGVELQVGDIQKAFDEMREAGVTLVTSSEIFKARR
ncbi:MAG: nicotinamidase [Gammaproteobacteria bacterium RIFCSPHIGHO2_12_FULL_43_28]|nr:MAG: nicotinamidase [Gammaproteobacteria bacterium RIFCSPHIGHO2_12_FULL_43_28]